MCCDVGVTCKLMKIRLPHPHCLFSRGWLAIGTLSLAPTACSGSGVDRFVLTKAPVVALTHIRVIDGTGRPGSDDQTLVIQDGRIGAVGQSGTVAVPSGAQVVDLSGRTVIPGLVGMHEHLFYQIARPSMGEMVVAAQAAFSKLYLAAGVTTIRTAGTVDFPGDLRIKGLVDAGKEPGPKIHVTGPYLYAVGAEPIPAEIARQVAEAANQGTYAPALMRFVSIWSGLGFSRNPLTDRSSLSRTSPYADGSSTPISARVQRASVSSCWASCSR